MADDVVFAERRVSYHGGREKEAVVIMAGREFGLGLGDTARCARDLGACARTLANLAESIRVSAPEMAVAIELQAHCRRITRWRERIVK